MWRKPYNNAYLHIIAVRDNPPYFTTEESIERPESYLKDDDSFGGMWGSGGAVYTSKHLDWKIESFREYALRCDVKPENIEIEWDEDAKKLYEELKDAKTYPEYVTAEWVTRKLNDEAYTLWRREERNEEIDYIRWFLEDQGKTPEEIEAILQKSRQIGYQQLYERTLKDIEWHKKHYIEPSYRKLMEMKAKLLIGEQVEIAGYNGLKYNLKEFRRETKEVMKKQADLEKYGKLIGILETPKIEWLQPIIEKVEEAFKNINIEALEKLEKLTEKKKKKAKKKRTRKKKPKAIDISDIVKQVETEPPKIERKPEEVEVTPDTLEIVREMERMTLGQVQSLQDFF